MNIWEIVLIGAALAMDAVAIGMAEGMAQPRMRMARAAAMAAVFGFFQFAMPLVGYVCGAAFSAAVGRYAPWLSFALLAFIGGKMLLDGIAGAREGRSGNLRPMLAAKRAEGAGAFAARLLAQGIATSLDALAVGVTFLAVQSEGGLPGNIAVCALVIGAVTLSLSFAAVRLGRCVGGKLPFTAGALGGTVLIAIGIKLLLEGIL